MSNVLDLSKDDRKALFVLSAEKMGFDPVIIEKDFWVVFTLNHLFSSGIPTSLVFKGGTSLSKFYNVIKRFSEDVDITIARADLGFDLSYDELIKKSRKARENLLKEMQIQAAKFVSNTIMV